MPYAQGEYKAGKRLALTRRNSPDEIIGALLTDSLQSEQVFLFQRIDIGYILDQPFFKKQESHSFADAPDIHSSAGGKKLQPCQYLGRAGGVGAIIHHFSLGFNHFCPAPGPGRPFFLCIVYLVPKAKFLTSLGVLLAFGGRADYLRDHLTAALDINAG